MRYIVVGDIHGCIVEFTQLLDDVSYNMEQDKLILLGDLIHKGPHSAGVVAFVYQLIEDGADITTVMGNHEEKHIRWRKKSEDKRAAMKHCEEYPSIQIPEDHWTMLERSVLWHQFYSGERLFTCVHGGFALANKELPDQHYFALTGKAKQKAGMLLRCRYVRPYSKCTNQNSHQHTGGGMVAMGHEKDTDFFWPEKYDGRFGHVFFGHSAFNERQSVREWDLATALDLGCVHGNLLAAAVVEGGHVTYAYVKAHKTYKEPLKLMLRKPE